MQTENNESNVSWIYLVPMRIVCPDTEKWPISARFGGEGCCVWQSPALCWQPNRVEEEGIIRITHTNIQIHTSTHKYLCTEYSHTLHQTWENVCMPACTEKKKESVSWLIFSTSNRAWRCGRCHVAAASALWQSHSRLNTAKTDRENRLCDIRHLSFISINTWLSLSLQGRT